MRRRRPTTICFVLAVITGAGCAPKTPPAPAPLKGVVDLDRLTPVHPGWRNLGQFDEAIAEMRRGASGRRDVLGDVSLETLPAIDVSAPRRPDIGLGMERRRLEALGAKQLTMLRTRTADERDLELRRERRLWDVEAEQAYQTSLTEIETRYASEYDRIIADQTQEKLNLMLQIRALMTTIDHWKLSTPPAPELLQAKRELADKQSRYDSVDTGLTAAVTASRLRRANEIAGAAARRTGYVDQKYAALETTLKADDLRQLDREARRLRAEREGLLAEIGSAETTSAPLVGSLAPETVREAQIAGASNLRGLLDGEGRIAAQRGRWQSFLRDDARVAAQDVATQNNWSIAFGKPGPGARDLTDEVAAALKAGVWKSGITSRTRETPSPARDTQSPASGAPSRPLGSSMTAVSKRN